MSNIPYCDEGWNVVTGCTPCSPGCLHCFAKATAERFPAAHGGWRDERGEQRVTMKPEQAVLGKRLGHDVRPVPFSRVVCHPDRLSKPFHWRKPRVVLVSAMGDWLHPQVPLDFIYRMLEVIARTPQQTYLTLTKRPERFARIGNPHMAVGLPNLWLGVTVCNQQEADEKIPILLSAPAAHRWVSVEPMLGPVDLSPWLPYSDRIQAAMEVFRGAAEELSGNPCRLKPKLDQVIVGCESGPKRRPMEHGWLSDLYEDCIEAGVPCYVKQASENADGTGKVQHIDPQPGELAWLKEE